MDFFWFITYLMTGLMVMGGVVGVILVKKNYKFKIKYWEVYSGVNQTNEKSLGTNYTITKLRSNLMKWNKTKTKWVFLFPLFFKKKKMTPFSSEFIYPGRTVYGFKLDESYLPVKVHLSNLEGQVFSVPPDVKEWQTASLLENAKDFAKGGFWEKNKNYIVMMLTVACCCALCGLTVWYSLKATSSAKEGADILTKAITGLQEYGGKPPV